MKGAMIGVMAGVAFMVATAASASPVYYTVNGAGPYQLDVTPITDTFSGASALSANGCALNCTLSAAGTLSDDLSGNTTLTVTSGSVSGGFLCSLVGLGGFPWTASEPHINLPSPLTSVPFTLGTVQVTSPCGNCSGDVAVTFHNSSGGYFEFSGNISGTNCSVNGNLSSSAGNYYVATH